MSGYYSPIQGFLDGLRPEEILLVSEWADKHRVIAQGTSPQSGQWRTSLFPFTKKVMDCLSAHSGYNQVVWMKSAQTGATEVGLNWIGYTIDNSPGAMLAIMPTESQMKRNSKFRIDPMIKASGRLMGKVASTNKKDATNTILQKEFPGGSLLMAGANSPSGLRSMPVKKIMMDEVDGYPLDLNGEGSPLSLAEARTMNYADYQIYLLSTPTVEGVSAIALEYEKTDQQKYYVCCPHCAAEQLFEWQQMRWQGKDDGKDNPVSSPPTAYVECVHCKGSIYERHKREMLAFGEWMATVPHLSNPRTIGFHINAMYSPLYTWERMVQKFLRAGNDVTKLNAFTNTDLGLTSKPMTDSPKWQDIYDKAVHDPENAPKNHVKFITAGVDVQKDRLEVSIVGWGHDKRRWLLDYRVLPGEVSDSTTFDQLDPILNEFWTREDGLELPLAKMCIDSGSYSAYVYNYCAKRYQTRKIVPVKGQDNLGRIIGSTTPVNKTEAGKDAPGVMLVSVGSSYMKTELYGYLKLFKKKEDDFGPKGYVHLLQLDEKYFKGLVAEEERIKKDKKGRNVTEWHVNFERNEPLDTMNYARAAASLVGIDRQGDHLNEWLDRHEDGYQKRTKKEVPAAEKKTLSNNKGGFWAGRK